MGQANEKNKMVYLSWEKMCLSKDERGLGFQGYKGIQSSSFGQVRLVVANEYQFFSSQGLQGTIFS